MYILAVPFTFLFHTQITFILDYFINNNIAIFIDLISVLQIKYKQIKYKQLYIFYNLFIKTSYLNFSTILI
jgi:hypothetical protein